MHVSAVAPLICTKVSVEVSLNSAQTTMECSLEALVYILSPFPSWCKVGLHLQGCRLLKHCSGSSIDDADMTLTCSVGMAQNEISIQDLFSQESLQLEQMRHEIGITLYAIKYSIVGSSNPKTTLRVAVRAV